MDIDTIVAALDANGAVFDALLRRAPKALQRWKPSPDDWCLLEIICHLLDEERDDFRARVGSVLDDPSQPLPAIDPQAWVAGHRYLEQDFVETLNAFLAEREASVRWLRTLPDPPWEQAYQHPKVGPLSARMLLVNWLAHDLLHIRQITRRAFQHLESETGLSLEYAGRW